MNKLVLEQLKELTGQMDWTLLHVKDENEETVMLVMGVEEWVDEFFGDTYSGQL